MESAGYKPPGQPGGGNVAISAIARTPSIAIIASDRTVIRCSESAHPVTGNRIKPRAETGRERLIGVAPRLLKQSETSG